MSAWLLDLTGQFGLLAIFAGCMAEGESFAILGGFLAHQGLFHAVTTFCVIASGAFLGDTLFFMLGHFFGSHPRVAAVKQRHGFNRVLALVEEHPAKFVVFNRYAYGFRVAGGIASGMANIAIPKFLALNALSSLIWATIFGSLGWFFGLGVEKLIGDALHQHQRLVIGILIGGLIAVASAIAAHHRAGKREQQRSSIQTLDYSQDPNASRKD